MTESAVSSAWSALSPGRSETMILISRCLEGEEQAYVTVYNQYAESIYRLCFSLLQHKEDAEEVLQDTFEYAFRKLDNYDPDRAGFKTWLYQIAVSRCRNKRRRKRLKTLSIQLFRGEEVIDSKSVTPSEHASLSERQKVVWQALGKLSPKLRETAVLRYYEGLTYAEIGNVLSIPPKTAESRIRLAHNALKKILNQDLLSD